MVESDNFSNSWDRYLLRALTFRKAESSTLRSVTLKKLRALTFKSVNFLNLTL
jgi:hypothetical protein